MSDDLTSVLRRKAAVARPDSGASMSGPVRAMRLALARAAEDVPGLGLIVDRIEEARRSLTELLDLLPERALLAIVEGPGDGLGVVALSGEVLSALIEVQTTGRVAAGAVAPRRPTRTDAMMSAALIDRMLAGLEADLAEVPDVIWAGGFRYASFLDDPRPLGLLLEDLPYRVFHARVEIARGARQGDILVALPSQGRGRAPRPRIAAVVASEAETAAHWSRAMAGAVLGAPAEVSAVLHRQDLPLAAVMALRAGDVLPIPADVLEHVTLEGIDGRRLGLGKLGQNRGCRALRLTRLPEAEPAPSAAAATPSAVAPAGASAASIGA